MGYLIFTEVSRKMIPGWRRVIMIFTCSILSILNPILLTNAYEGANEITRKMAKVMSRKVVLQMRHARAIKNQWSAFLKIELGKLLKLKLSICTIIKITQ